jgi:hypothetical protein
MVITSKTKLREIGRILPLVELSNIDLMKECSRFAVPDRIRGVKVMPFRQVAIRDLKWLWDTTDNQAMLLALVEVFFYSQLPKWRKWLNPDSEKWARRWMVNCPLIDFYRVAGYLIDEIKNAADQFASIQINLTPEESEAGYGKPDPDSVQKMIDSFARRMGITSHEEAAAVPWVIYLSVFKWDADSQNLQRKYNAILTEKAKRK